MAGKKPASSDPDQAQGAASAEKVVQNPALPFPVIGIGASAGGLAAFEAFFSGMPTDQEPGMAFVLVQHLAPDHKSLLADLIQRSTRMQVYEVVDGMKVQPNCAYIIPPNRDMTFENGTLQLLEPLAPRGQRLPIDFFFRSLARDQRERAICIILSGSGSDGTLGMRAVKAEGGMAMAQNPESTEYDSMPRSAIATGLVDYEMPPAEMPAQLMNYITRFLHSPQKAVPIKVPKIEDAMGKIHVLLRVQTGHDFSRYKPNTIQRRIERRMAVHQFESLDGYVGFLQQHPEEVEALFRDLLIGVTSFFRDPDAFQSMAKKVIPRLFADKSAGSTIRIWVPGCSTGEEAYSIAMLLQEHLDGRQPACKIQIFATDLDRQSITMARTGIYPAGIAADLSPERLARFFTVHSEKGSYRVIKLIRDMVIFSEQDLIKDPPFSRMDLISCRNLLIYMGSELQKHIMPIFHYALLPGGVLFLGSSETTGEFNTLFSALDKKWKLYLRRDGISGARPTPIGAIPPAPHALERVGRRALEPGQSPDKPKLRELTERALLEFTAPTGILVNAQGDILYQHGRAGLFLEPVPGEPGISNIMKMAREGLRRELTTALHKAIRNGKKVKCPKLQIVAEGHVTIANLTIFPLPPESSVATGEGSSAFLTSTVYLVVIEPSPDGAHEKRVPATLESPAGKEADVPESQSGALIDTLRLELKAKDEYLQATREELETAGEELKSSNEEMQSVNEELQSTNEELETSKEELQSINEELATVNSELQAKVADLSAANNDMNNLLAGTGIATIFVDHQLQILRFTPAATNLINLIQSDMGRPFSHIVTKLVGYDKLVADIHTVLDTLVPIETTVETEDALWYTLRIQPYRTVDNVIAGAVITFVEITEMKRVWESLRISEERYRQLFEAVQEGILIVDADTGSITDVNPFLSVLSGYNREHFIDKLFWEIGLFEEIVPDATDFVALQQKKYSRFQRQSFHTADGRTIQVEFISNVHEVGSHRFMQCNVRRLP